LLLQRRQTSKSAAWGENQGKKQELRRSGLKTKKKKEKQAEGKSQSLIYSNKILDGGGSRRGGWELKLGKKEREGKDPGTKASLSPARPPSGGESGESEKGGRVVKNEQLTLSLGGR